MSDLKSKIESLLFVANKPLTVKELSDFLELKNNEIEVVLEELINDYENNGRGYQLSSASGKYQLTSSAENAALVRKFLEDETSGELSRPSLETLTIIAYRGPITKIDLDRIRGVNCALILRNLLIRGLIEEKVDEQKNETYYNASLDFIRFLGVNRVSELPDYEQLHSEEAINKLIERAEAEAVTLAVEK